MLSERLTQRGYLPPRLADAYAAVDRAHFVPARYRHLSDLDVPLPTMGADHVLVSTSPRGALLHVLALDVEPGARVLADVTDGGHVAALLAELVGPDGHVTVATGDARLASVAAKRLRAQGYGPERVSVHAEPPYRDAAFDRILLTRPGVALPASARASLTDWGVLVARLTTREGDDLVKIVRSGHEYATLHLGDVNPVPEPLGEGAEDAWPASRLLLLEDALRRTWQGRAGTMEEAEFERAVEETWRPLRPHEDVHAWALARVLFHTAYVQLLAGDLDAAEDGFRASFDTLPTAEALTFLGWTWSFSGRLEDAIDACRRAIDVDPAFGNAYNDIGAYLVEMGRTDEAIPWLLRAVRAPRYGARAYPFANLARVHLLHGDLDEARRMLEAALGEDPEYEPARVLLDSLDEAEEWDGFGDALA